MLKTLFILAVAMAVTVRAVDLDSPGSLLDGSESGDNSAFSSSDADSLADKVAFPPETLPPVAPPVADGVKMFGQCGGIFYTGNNACADSDAYCKELSTYSSICSPKPVK